MFQEKITMREFQRRFATEKDCVDRLFKLRWPDGYSCPKCGHRRYSFHGVRKLYQCKKCKYQASVTAGTIFHKTRTSLVQWFWIVFIMTRQKSGVSMLSLQGMLGVKSYKTVWTMCHKIRKAMADQDGQHQWTGLVETLEAFLKPAKSGSRPNKTEGRPSILVTVENRGDSPGFAMMKHVPGGAEEKDGGATTEEQPSNTRSRHGQDAAQEDVESGNSDDELNPLLISDRKPQRMRWARILLTNLKGNLRGVHHGVSEKHLHRYLAEFLYRFNRRAWSSQLLNRALKACVSVRPITYEELIT